MSQRLLSTMQRCTRLACASVRPRVPALAAPLGPRATQPLAPSPPPRSWLPRLLWSRALHATSLASSSQQGPITSDLIASMRSKIAAALETDMVEVQDMQGDGRHVEITVISKVFEGKNAVSRQRMVYKAIWEELQNTVHAVDAMVTRTPEEAGM